MIKRDKQILCIKHVFKDVQSITVPAVSGFVHNVYIVKSADKKYICRFSDKTTAEHNFRISKLLLSYNINVPDISINKFGDMYYEVYPFIKGKTLHERILEGMSDEAKDKVYEQLFNLSYRIAAVQYEPNSIPRNNNMLAKIVTKIFDKLNAHEPKVLTHTDLNAKNIILDEEDNISALLDLDSITDRSFSAAFVSMRSCAKAAGYTPKKLIKP